MANVVIFGGTVEGRLLAEAFEGTELILHLCVATSYGASLLPDCGNLKIHAGRMNEEEMEVFLSGLSADYCLDATHPYAAAVTENIVKACESAGIPYLRVLREEGQMEQPAKGVSSRIVYCDSIGEAAAFLEHTEGKILITTGSRDLEAYTRLTDYQSRCIARVLPTFAVMEKCKSLGFEGKNLIGMQGPFSEELNYWMLKQTGASWLVTKNSGKEGGYREKCEAAIRADVNLLIVGRKKEPVSQNSGCVLNLLETVEFLKKQYGINDRRQVFLVGMGPGDPELLTEEAKECLQQCDVMIGAGRVLEIWPGYRDKPFFKSYCREEIRSFLEEHPEYRRAVIAYSGDIGFYSGARGMEELLAEYEVHPVSGISSAAYFLNRLGIPWEGVKLVSCHGKSVNLLPMIRRYGKVCALIGKGDAVKEECGRLEEFGMEQVRVTVGERLSYPEERIYRILPGQITDREISALSVVLFENPVPADMTVLPDIRDDAFLRGKVPMTKREIRTLSLSKLRLTEDAVVYDIGAGTGSVSVEAALLCGEGTVYAVEKNPEAVRLIRENAKRFGAANLKIVEGEAPDCLAGLPAPTHVFIGGTGGNMAQILQAVREKNESARFVINAVTLETVAQLTGIPGQFPEYRDMELLQVNVARGRELGRYHLLSAENPVMIVSFGGEK